MRSVDRAGTWLQGAGAAFQTRLTGTVMPSPLALASVDDRCIYQAVLDTFNASCCAVLR